MSIASRIEAIEQHLTDDYSVLTLSGADLTNVDKNILNLKPTWKERLLYFMNNGTQQVWDNWDKVNGTGTTLTLNNTEEAPMSLVYKGNTLQNGAPTPDSPIPIQVVSGDNTIKVEGKNLIYEYHKSGNILFFNGAGAYGNYVFEAGTYTFSYKNANNCSLYYQDETGNSSNLGIGKATTFTINKKFNIWLYRSSLTLEEFSEIQLEKGNQATEYQEHEEATYQITLPEGTELCKIGTYQDKIDKSNGKNLFDKENTVVGWLRNTGTINPEAGSHTSDYIEIKPNTNYIRTTSEGNCYYDENKTFISYYYGKNIATPNNAKYLRITVNDNYINNEMLNEGTTALEYEPYGTDWYVKKEIGKWYGKDYEWADINVAQGTLHRTTTYVNNLLINTTGFSDFYKCLTQATRTNPCFYINSESAYIDVIDNDVPAGTFKTYCETNGIVFYAPLATPTYETITDTTLISQLETIKKSYEGQTNISQVNNDMPFILDITALSKE